MITQLTGRLLEKRPTDVVLDVHGVGYDVMIPLSVFASLPDTGETVTLFTHFVVREDAQQLYGFTRKAERQLFRDLIRVNGVGPKLGIAILSGMDVDAFVHCVHEGDTSALVRLPGVGKKTAERLIVEMRDRLEDWSPTAVPAAASSGDGDDSDRMVAEAEGALVALGYKPPQAARAIQAVLAELPEPTAETLIRRALKSMAPG